MRKVTWVGLWLALGGMLLSACVYPARTGSLRCWLTIDAAVRQGPDAGLRLAGTLEIQSGPSAAAEGTLRLENGTEVHTVGQLSGRAVNLLFDLGNDNRLFVVGVMEKDYPDCEGIAGGTLAGPKPGDLGDWSGRWELRQADAGTVGPTSFWFLDGLSPLFCILVALTLTLAIVGAALVKSKDQAFLQAALKKAPFVNQAALQAALKKAPFVGAKVLQPQPWPGEPGIPLMEVATIYIAGDDRYDFSFEIEQQNNFLGECGITIAATLDKSTPKKVTALELWLFDKSDIRTEARVLLSEGAYTYPMYGGQPEGEAARLELKAGQDVTLDTQSLHLRAEVQDVQYPTDEAQRKLYFQQVILKLAVWSKTSKS